MTIVTTSQHFHILLGGGKQATSLELGVSMTRKAFVATDAMRERVLSLARVGTTENDIAKIIDCDPKTLRKYFRDELDRGMAEATAEVAGFLFANAKAGNVAAQIFWMKARARWQEREASENPTPSIDAEPTAQVVVI